VSPEEQNEGAEEAIEDLEAPAAAQGDVAGGAKACLPPTCKNASKTVGLCEGETCVVTSWDCTGDTHYVTVFEK
jgi:hypothetical protein